MRWNATAKTWALLVFCCGGTSIPALADDGPPPLTPPADAAPVAPTPIPAVIAPKPEVPRPIPRGDDRPVLALPGINTPSSRAVRPVTATLPPPSMAPSSDGGLPPLEMPGTKTGVTSTPDLMPLPSDRFRGRVIESSPTEDILPSLDAPPIPAQNRLRSTTTPPSPGSSSRSRLLLNESDSLDPIDIKELKDSKGRIKLDKDKDKEEDKPLQSLPRRGLFSRFLPRPMTTESDSVIKAEPRSDPAADAAIKRRVERQARETVGDRARSIEVRVVGRSITIQAHGVKFLQRRTVRKSLEGLSGISGYKSVVEVLD